jgi:hypothetical protein
MNKLILCAALAVAAIACIACAQTAGPQPEPERAPETGPGKTPEKAPPAEDAEITLWRDQLLAAAAQYREYTKMADDPAWGPLLCRAPMYRSAMISQAESGAHGRKLYFLWVKQPDPYQQVGWVGRFSDLPEGTVITQPVGQVLVKESFVPGTGADPDKPHGPRPLGQRSDLFVMLKLDPSTPGTDGGWVYGTLTPDGKTVTGAGRMAGCMKCHTGTAHDRMFGLPETGGKANGNGG